MTATADMWGTLAAPLPPGSTSWRQDGKPFQRDGKNLARFVAYVDANTVRERLDSVAPGEWTIELTPLPSGADADGVSVAAFKARLTVRSVAREDVGTGRDYKAAATDAFKRSAVRFGVASELHRMFVFVELDGDGKYAKPVEDPGVAYARKHRVPAQPSRPASPPMVDPRPPRDAPSAVRSQHTAHSRPAPARKAPEPPPLDDQDDPYA